MEAKQERVSVLRRRRHRSSYAYRLFSFFTFALSPSRLFFDFPPFRSDNSDPKAVIVLCSH